MNALALAVALFAAGTSSSAWPAASTPDAVDRAAIDAYRAANARLLERMERGLRATVHLVRPDGTVADGFDEYMQGRSVRLREVRPDRESIVVGTRICSRAPGAAFQCSTGEVELGLRAVDDTQVYAATRTEADCGRERCTDIAIVQRDVPDDLRAFLEAGGTRVDPTSRYELLLRVRPDGLPVSLREVRRTDDGLVEPDATFVFDYDTAIGPIRLPDDADVAPDDAG